MATSKPNQPVETTYSEYLHDDTEEDHDGSDPSLSHHANLYADLQTLTEKLETLERNETSTKLEIRDMKMRVDTLQEEVRKDKERLVTAETRQGEAESFAVVMATERAHIALERNEVIRDKSVLEERLRQVHIACQRAEGERDKMEKDYQAKISVLKRTHNRQNNTLQLWEREIKKLNEENAELKKENNFLTETFFEVNPSPQDRQRLKCFSCRQSYSVETYTDNECAFHPLPPVRPSVWHRWKYGHLDKYLNSEHRQYEYWSCCNTLSAKGRRPDGCRKGPHHQRWEMDVMMKRIMLSRDILDETDGQEEPKIL